MNSLSWFLYLAETLPNLSVLVFLLGIVLFIGYLVWSFIVFNPHYWGFDSDQTNDRKRDRIKTAWKVWPFALSLSMLAISTMVPSKKTIYLVAGSEAGEYVVTSHEGQEIINDIKTIIKSQIEGLK